MKGMYPMYGWPTRQDSELVKRVMEVTGNGEVAAEPTMAVFQLAVITESESLRDAQQENAKKMSMVIQALVESGVPSEHIQTATYTVEPRYDYVDGKQIFRGYKVINEISVKNKQLEQTGYLIDSAVQNGVNRVSNIQFKVEDASKLEKQALSLALEDAVSKANALANTMQTNIVPIPVKIREWRREEPVLYKTMAVSQEQTPIAPGQIVIRATLQVTFHY